MTAAEIAEILAMALSTVSAVLKRIGLGKRSRLTPPEPPNRYERKRAGELVHLDIKKLGRILAVGHRIYGSRKSQKKVGPKRLGGAGWEFVHVAVDDATRLAYAEVLPNELGQTAAAFLRRAVAWFEALGIRVERVLSDNGACYRSRVLALACSELGIRRHLFTRPYRPRTNGKAERFIQTLANRWAYGAIYGSSAERNGGAAGLADPLQLQPSTRRPRPQAARHSPARADERGWELQLVHAERHLRGPRQAAARACDRQRPRTGLGPAGRGHRQRRRAPGGRARAERGGRPGRQPAH
jgi:transposase InsO family protein